mmetsp:Transcript_17458/g.33898  ORF Transcript_17458/g.33898 Transcript_17458/m.33898 type:complete len:84 (+) Transcript_17458:261-512(+)
MQNDARAANRMFFRTKNRWRGKSKCDFFQIVRAELVLIYLNRSRNNRNNPHFQFISETRNRPPFLMTSPFLFIRCSHSELESK